MTAVATTALGYRGGCMCEECTPNCKALTISASENEANSTCVDSRPTTSIRAQPNVFRRRPSRPAPSSARSYWYNNLNKTLYCNDVTYEVNQKWVSHHYYGYRNTYGCFDYELCMRRRFPVKVLMDICMRSNLYSNTVIEKYCIMETLEQVGEFVTKL